MDTVLLFSGGNLKLSNLLERLGYKVVISDGACDLSELLGATVVDAVVLDKDIRSENGAVDRVELSSFLREFQGTKDAPVILHEVSASERTIAKHRNTSRVELVDEGSSVGLLASRIAMALRLRKGSGQDAQASLADANTALRDLNTRFLREREEARSIQESLLPHKLPNDPRYELACSYQPLDEVGGDWYYVKKEPSGCIMLQIADVTGHGLAAAFIGSMTKLALSAVLNEAPAERLAEMNKLMTPQLPEGRFVTIASALYDPTNGKLDLAVGGHPAPIVYSSRTGQASTLTGDGFAFGFFDGGEYQGASVNLEPGDLVVLYTDGISEAQNRDMKMFGMDRVREVVASSAAGGSAAVLTALVTELDRFMDGRALKDDVTLVALRRVI